MKDEDIMNKILIWLALIVFSGIAIWQHKPDFFGTMWFGVFMGVALRD